MSEVKRYGRTEGALPVEIYFDIEMATDLLDQARTEYSRRGLVFDVEKPDPMTVAISILRGVQARLKKAEERELPSLYMGVFLGGLLGVVGNFFVSFWFQLLTVWTVVGLILSGGILLLVCVALWTQAKKYAT